MQNTDKIKTLINELEALQPNLHGKDFLLTWENSVDNLKAVMLVAEILQLLHKEKQPWRIFDYGLAISIFRDNSTRTRFSFASAVNGLGLALSELDEVKSQIAHGETVRETAGPAQPRVFEAFQIALPLFWDQPSHFASCRRESLAGD
jgi:aspartate carbamoyltransferase catalytic subunit